jgi:hypothetical protein
LGCLVLSCRKAQSIPELRSFLSHRLLLMIEEKLFWALEELDKA